ncbi:hypothetical protein PTKIN_Ptkin02bG0051700 [Pterospermum kingtungense]
MPTLVDTSALKPSRKFESHLMWMVRLKFNVDGSSLSQHGPAGIGGILRDSDANIILCFSKAAGNIDSNLAELMAVKEAFQLFISSQWALSHALAVESDSSNVVMWVNNPDKTPWRMRNLMAIIENMKLQVIGWSISHILREANEVADKLAKSGVKRQNDLVVYLD